MRRNIGLLIASSITVLLAFTVPTEQALSEPNPGGLQPASGEPAFAPGRILVKVKDNAPADAIASVNRNNGAHVEEKIPHSRVNVVDLPEDLSIAEAVNRYEASPNVEYAEPDYVVSMQNLLTDDIYYPKLWGLNNTGQVYRTELSGTSHSGNEDADIDAPEAWSTTTGTADTVVAVVDTGMDVSHPDLDANVWTNPDETPGNGVDDDENGYVDDVYGWDFVNDDASVYDSATYDRHGTHVAGTIAAERNNGTGVTGVAPQVKVMSLKFIGPQTGYLSDAIEALNYAVAEGVKISSNSWGCYCPSEALLDAIRRADASGHLFVAAAENGGEDKVGDDNDSNPVYPASYDSPNIISVAASNDQDDLTTFSNYGATSVDLAAPGENILSTLPDNHYGFFYGTSMATPHVAGTAALVKSEFPVLNDDGIKALILESVDEKASLQGKLVTGGSLNAAEALALGADAAPIVLDVRPRGKIRDRTPVIRATVRDDETELTESQIELYVNGELKQDFSYDQAEDKLVYTSGRLSHRTHTVQVVVEDSDGLENTRTWYFRVVHRR